MHKYVDRSIVLCFLATILSGCGTESVRTVEVTRIIPQTVVATQIVQETVVYKQGSNSSFEIDPAYYDGIITITQYYTYLDQALYEEAYQLLSSEARHPKSLEEYVEGAERFFEKVEILAIHPYYYE